jgi:hypothetical protein
MKQLPPNASGNPAFDVNNHTKHWSFARMRNFCAWKESALESMTLLLINVLANNLINRIWGEVWTVVLRRAARGLRFFCAWQIIPYESIA